MADSSKERREQITVVVDRELRLALERAAADEHRTVSGLVRHLITQAVAGDTGEGLAA